jgi:carbonic anhydrase
MKTSSLNSTSRWFVALAAAGLLVAGCSSATSSSPTTTAPSHGAHWEYSGSDGPSHWGSLGSSYATCADGSAQSPINLTNAVLADAPDPEIQYGDSTASVVNNGHTIQASPARGGTISVSGTTYALSQIHFHAPSEHVVNGNSYPVEVHFVNTTADGKVAVLGVFLTPGGADNPAWDSYIKTLATPKSLSESAKINFASLLPADRSTFRYGGSLTTPPCTEGVSWLVFTTAVQVSQQQIDAFVHAYDHNNRPVEPLDGRTITIDHSTTKAAH